MQNMQNLTTAKVMTNEPKKTIRDFVKPNWFIQISMDKESSLGHYGLEDAQIGDKYAFEVSELNQKAGIIRFNLVKIK